MMSMGLVLWVRALNIMHLLRLAGADMQQTRRRSKP